MIPVQTNREIPRTLPITGGRVANKNLKAYGKLSTHCRIGSHAGTSSTSEAELLGLALTVLLASG